MENPLLNKRQIEILLKEAKKELENDPDNPEVLELVSSISALGEKYDETLIYLEKTLIAIRNEPLIYLLKAHCHLHMKEYDLMKQEYLRFSYMEAKESYWEDEILAKKIETDEELERITKLVKAETEVHLTPFINTVKPLK